MVPLPGGELFGRIRFGRNLSELGAASGAVELELLTFEIRVTDTEQKILFHAHNGGNAHIVRVVFVDVNKGFVCHGSEVVIDGFQFCFCRVVKTRETNEIVSQLDCHGDG